MGNITGGGKLRSPRVLEGSVARGIPQPTGPPDPAGRVASPTERRRKGTPGPGRRGWPHGWTHWGGLQVLVSGAKRALGMED